MGIFLAAQASFYAGDHWIYPLSFSFGMLMAHLVIGLIPVIPLTVLSVLVLNLVPIKSIPLAGAILLLATAGCNAVAGLYWGMLMGI